MIKKSGFTVGGKITVRLTDGRIVDAVVRAVISEGQKLQVDNGNEETALIHQRQVVKE